ncbi:hypothetical protein CFE70_009871 [Pyrenophora teres f. teres 0-1]|uniref:Uncharacterized protein n=2 Tax=Pyrenophora teres f. teres TaxID=97479 RepID=E3RZS5_PYRTT|nr:hypothetical protein PTT_15226 [Pyrenophora teres f. teres 0-1]KAE8826917.1 hypothetical protein HRS9139_08089 [Pyrenophora teres f. teres]KAE8832435.1 hypothetical protein PTNB85_06827 [Pyrenophora teres f. teres]KAE8836957.1 hypothetical protein HRS9122_07112 [Pyrenophora teres f. teres]KAE8856097.1 hypothetical protein PTNB29_08936 [Pyrenophora teres f. teres]
MSPNLTMPTSRLEKGQRTSPPALSDIAESAGLNTPRNQRAPSLSKLNPNNVDDTPTPYKITKTLHGKSTTGSFTNTPQAPVLIRSPGLDTFRRKAAEVFFNDGEDEKDPFIGPTISRKSIDSTDLAGDQAAPTQNSIKDQIRSPSSTFRLSVPRSRETFPLRPYPVPNYDTFSMSSRRLRGSPSSSSEAWNRTAEKEVVTPTGSPGNRSKGPPLSTIKLNTKNLYDELGYSSRGFWEQSGDEFVEMEGTPRQPSDTRFSSAHRNTSSENVGSPISSLQHLSRTPTKQREQEHLVAHLQALELSPCETIRKSATSKFKSSLTSSACPSPLRSVEHSPTKQMGSWLSKTSDPAPSEAVQPNTSMWDADDEEFDRWPGQETLDRVGQDYTTRGRQMRGLRSTSNSAPAACDTNFTVQKHEDVKHELLDRHSGNPYGMDAHDSVMSRFFATNVPDLPASNPPRHMHIIAHDAYLGSADAIVRCAMPRLCDAVATVLYLTNPKCLKEFLDPNVKVFEWRRSGNRIMIRREGDQVIVGTYANFGTNYVWTYFVRSNISNKGLWTETYASVSVVVTPVSRVGVMFDQVESELSSLGIEPTDLNYALFMGRDLAYFLLSREPWRYHVFRQWVVEWEADGVVTEAVEFEREMLRQVTG